MDASDPETVALIRKAADLERVLNRVYALCEGSGGHYRDTVEAIMEECVEYWWPNLGKPAVP